MNVYTLKLLLLMEPISFVLVSGPNYNHHMTVAYLVINDGFTKSLTVKLLGGKWQYGLKF